MIDKREFNETHGLSSMGSAAGPVVANLLEYCVQHMSSPFDVVIECVDDNEFVASIPELNIAMSGESAGDAFRILKEHVMDVYELLLSCDRLGPEPSRQLSILEKRNGRK